MIPVIELTTEHLTLQPLGPGDADYCVALHRRNQRTTFDALESFDTPAAWAQYLQALLDENMTGWRIVHTATTIPLGIFYVTQVTPGILANLNPVSDIPALKDVQPMNGNGQRLRVMDESATVIMPYLVQTFALQRIGGAFYSNNVPGIKFCERLGLRREGVVRHGSCVRGRPVDIYLFGQLSEEVLHSCHKPSSRLPALPSAVG